MKRQDDALDLAGAVRRLKAGTDVEEASRLVVARFGSRLRSYFLRHGFSDSDADDLVQETFRRVFTAVGTLATEAAFMGWMFQIARNVRSTAIAARASRGHPADLSDDIATDGRKSPLEHVLLAENVERTRLAIAGLPPQQKQCLVLRAAHEMSYEEIGRVLQLSVRTVRNHLREARRNLRRALANS